jgi:hypothetical protein
VKEEIRALINEGLFGDNLLKLVDLCDASFDRHPSIYGSLSYIFRNLAEEYGGQGIKTERYETITKVLKPPILALLEVEGDGPPETIPNRLDEAYRAFRAVSY